MYNILIALPSLSRHERYSFFLVLLIPACQQRSVTLYLLQLSVLLDTLSPPLSVPLSFPAFTFSSFLYFSVSLFICPSLYLCLSPPFLSLLSFFPSFLPLFSAEKAVATINRSAATSLATAIVEGNTARSSILGKAQLTSLSERYGRPNNCRL